MSSNYVTKGKRKQSPSQISEHALTKEYTERKLFTLVRWQSTGNKPHQMQALKVTCKICCSTWLIRGYPKLVGWSMEKSFCGFLFSGYFLK